MGDVTNQPYRQPRKEEVDQEWIELIGEALRIGMTKEEVRMFLRSNGSLENNQHVIKSEVSGI